ncbi:MAG: glycoside hydrolase family 3 C-terminal domain-containing protein [Armatimonadetes bacterium]|nr:glycoside hydrolase family 3 C-terminal domain-containing protein [Armatimonadota bacterium]
MLERLSKLLAGMSLDEKVAQLGSISIRRLMTDGKFDIDKAKELLKHGIGQITRIAGGSDLPPKEAAQLANEIQRFLIEETRLGIPAIVHEECLSGLMARGATTFPQSINLASTFEPDLVREMTTAIRKEMRAIGAHQGLAPVLDVLRDPRWGRTEETFGEDPYLIACMAVAYITGLQGENLRHGVIATAKHFSGHGFPEGGRNCAPVHAGLREFREVLSFPFEAAVRVAKVQSVMNAYHDIDGIPCAASRELLTDLLRGEWGFDGIVVSDYGSVQMLFNVHKVAIDEKDAACQAIYAGIDIELPDIHCYAKLIDAVKEGLISEAALDEAVRRVLTVKERLGLFDNPPFVDPDAAVAVFDAPEHRKIARLIAQKSIVLLKNDGDLLPLRKDLSSIAVIGPNANEPRNLLGDYAYMAHLDLKELPVPIVTVLEGIKAKVSSATKVLYAKGCEVFGGTTEGISEAVEIAMQAEVIVLVVGDRSGLFGRGTVGEGCDRVDLRLTGHQEQLVKAIVEIGKPVVLVLINGRPVTLGELFEKIPAIVEAWFPGEEGGNAVADVLFGDVNPSGKLPITFPKVVGQVPLHYSRAQISHRDYVEMSSAPQFPFGHGLSYTKFEYSDLMITPEKISPAGKVTISLKVKNVGNREGDEVVQLYVRDVVASRVRPVKELKGFKRITLKPNEAKRVTFFLSADQLAFYDRAMRFVVEPGSFEVMVGSSSEDIRLKGNFEVIGKVREVPSERIMFTNVEVESV